MTGVYKMAEETTKSSRAWMKTLW